MTKKISSVELEQIITEEIEKVLVDEGFGDFVKRVAGAGKAAVSGALEKGKEKWKQIGQQQAEQKGVLELTARFLSQFQNQLINNQTFKSTPLFKKYISSLEEAFETNSEKAIMRDLQTNIAAGRITVQEIVQSMQMMAKDKELRRYIASTSNDAEKVFGLEGGTSTQPTQQTPQAQTEPAKAKNITRTMGDIVAQGRSEQEPKSDKKTPKIDDFIEPGQTDKINRNSGYKLLAQNLNLDWETQVKPMFNYLVSKGLLYKMSSIKRIREQENPIKIWQDYGIKTEEELRRHPFFISLVNAIKTATGVDRTKSIPFLVAIWEQGKLVKPKGMLDGPEYTKADIERIYSQPDYDEFYSGLSESKRWKQLAGILKD